MRLASFAALLGALSVVLGAFGAHALTGQVPAERLAVWATACDYLAWHAAALLALSALFAACPGLAQRHLARGATALLLGGILLFSGSLIILVLSGIGLWGAVTPIGGSALVLGWLGLAIAFWHHSGSPD